MKTLLWKVMLLKSITHCKHQFTSGTMFLWILFLNWILTWPSFDNSQILGVGWRIGWAESVRRPVNDRSLLQTRTFLSCCSTRYQQGRSQLATLKTNFRRPFAFSHLETRKPTVPNYTDGRHLHWIWYPGGRSRMFGREIFPLSPSSNSTITPPGFPSSDEPPAWDINVVLCLLKSNYLHAAVDNWPHLCERNLDKGSVSARSSKRTPWFLHWVESQTLVGYPRPRSQTKT